MHAEKKKKLCALCVLCGEKSTDFTDDTDLKTALPLCCSVPSVAKHTTNP